METPNPTNLPRVTIFAAMSLDGYIADLQGSEDFLSHAHWETFQQLAKTNNNFIMGQKAYEAVLQWPDYSFSSVEAPTKIILSKNPSVILPDTFIKATSPKEALIYLRDRGCESALVTGGGQTNRSFITEHLAHEIIINIEPVILGGGIPFLADIPSTHLLALTECTQLTEGIVQLRYTMLKE